MAQLVLLHVLRSVRRGVLAAHGIHEKQQMDGGTRNMRRKALVLGSVIAFALGISLFASPSNSAALTITSISVTVGDTTWCDTTGSCAALNKIWNLGGGITLLGGQSLILTQTGGFNNFDSSENGGGAVTGSGLLCNSSHFCATSLTINGVLVTLGGGGQNILANNNGDVGGVMHNEASNWSLVGDTPGGPGSVFFGYADTLHSNNCADPDNCLPNSGSGVANLWDGTGGSTRSTFFLGQGSLTGKNLIDHQNPDGFHCILNNGDSLCYDAGAILITANAVVPEPSTVLLVGTLIIGLTGLSLRRNRKTV